MEPSKWNPKKGTLKTEPSKQNPQNRTLITEPSKWTSHNIIIDIGFKCNEFPLV
jgi:hypothetical protein